MGARNRSNMSQGFYYDMGKNIGYNITVNNLYFSDVAYHSKGQLIKQLVNSGYNLKSIEVKKVKID